MFNNYSSRKSGFEIASYFLISKIKSKKNCAVEHLELARRLELSYRTHCGKRKAGKALFLVSVGILCTELIDCDHCHKTDCV